MNEIQKIGAPTVGYARTKYINTIVKSATATMLGAVHKLHQKDVIKQFYPDFKGIVTRTGVLPTTMTTGSTLIAAGKVLDLAVMGPGAAAATLFDGCLQYTFDKMGVIQVPPLIPSASDAGFVGEGSPIPVREFSFASGVSLVPTKFATISVFSREIFEHSLPNIERTVQQVIAESLNLALDTAVFDATAAGATRPAGLLLGVAAGSESANPISLEAMKEDVKTLVTAVAAVSGNAPLYFIAAPAQAAALRVWAQPSFNYVILSSGALSAGTVICISANALASACDANPRFESSTTSVVHMSDAPTDISKTPGVLTGGGAEGGTVKSLWQTDCVSLKTIFEVSWVLRSSSGIALLQNVIW